MKYLAVLWINGELVIDGQPCFETMKEAMKYCDDMPKFKGHEYTICRIEYPHHKEKEKTFSPKK